MLDRVGYLRAWSRLHGGVAPNGLVGAWLRSIYGLARPVAERGVPPGVITLTGLLSAAAALPAARAGDRWLLLAAVAVVASAALDGVDGAVAVLSDRTTRAGAVLDSSCDRLAELCYAGALWLAGAPAGWCVAAGGLALLHEHLRASATGHGMPDVGIVTVSERPTRVIVSAAFLLGCGLYPAAAADWAALGAIAGTLAGAVGFTQLAFVVRHRLTQPPG